MAQSNNMDALINMLSKMDKKQLEEGLSQVNKILSSSDKEKILSELQKNIKKQ